MTPRTSVFILLFAGGTLFAQESINASIGADFPEGMNIGMRYGWQQYQAGLSIGQSLGTEIWTSVTADFWYHSMGAITGYAVRKPGYFRFTISFIRTVLDRRIDKDVYVGPRIGREMMISSRMGIRADFGLLLLADSRSIDRDTGHVGESLGLTFDLIPAAGMAVFYRFSP